MPADQQQQRFFDYWTLKESYIKARGEGLAIPLSKFSFVFAGNKLTEFRVETDLQDDADCWQFWRIAIAEQYGADQYGADRYQIALAIKSENSDHKVTAFHSIPLQSNVPFALSFL